MGFEGVEAERGVEGAKHGCGVFGGREIIRQKLLEIGGRVIYVVKMLMLYDYDVVFVE